MRVLILTKNWGRNFTGATLATQYLVNRWIGYGAFIDVYTLNIGECIRNERIHVYKADSIRKLKKIIFSNKKAYVESTIGYSDDHFGYILHEFSIPFIHTYHGNWPDAKNINFEMWLKSYYFIPLYKKTFKCAEIVVNVSRYMETFTKRYSKETCVIHNGIEIKQMESQIKEYNTYLMVGNIDKRKYGLLPEVANFLRRMDESIKIEIYGQVLDIKLAQKISACANIKLLGEQKEIPYKKYVGFINTSKMENLSISVCEAIKNQLPVFCFDVGGLTEVVEDYRTGFIFKCFSTKEMANSLASYCNGDKLLISSDALYDFDWEIAGKEYYEIMMRRCNK